MLNLKDYIHSLTNFKRNTNQMLEQIRRSGRPIVLTVNGKAEVVVQDADSYQALIDRLETIEAIRRGLLDVEAGRTKTVQDVFDGLGLER